MLTRRAILVGALATGIILRPRTSHAKASQPATPVTFEVPAGACDCHTHIHGDPAQFPFFAGRTYTPEMALPEEMAALHKALHIQRVVIVTPSVYGTDNAATLYGMQARGADARGVAVIDDQTPDSALDTMGQAGVRGIRLNLATAGITDPAVARQRFQAAAARMQRRQWHVQLNTNLTIITALKDLVATASVPVGVRSFRRGQGRTRATAAGLCRSRGAGPLGQGLCEDLGCLSRGAAGAGLCRRGAASPGADYGQCGAHRLGHRLAASNGDASRGQADGRHAAAPD
jgi:hypothetical protein